MYVEVEQTISVKPARFLPEDSRGIIVIVGCCCVDRKQRRLFKSVEQAIIINVKR